MWPPVRWPPRAYPSSAITRTSWPAVRPASPCCAPRPCRNATTWPSSAKQRRCAPACPSCTSLKVSAPPTNSTCSRCSRTTTSDTSSPMTSSTLIGSAPSLRLTRSSAAPPRTPTPTSKLVRPQTSTTRKCRASSSPSWTSSPRPSDANTISLSTTVILKPPRS